MNILKPFFSCLTVLAILLSVILFINKTYASSSAVRLSVTASSGNGIEQELADHISARLQDISNIAISTLNPDWYVSCKIDQNEDRFTGQIKCNGTVTVKSQDGQMISTVSDQIYHQDYNPQLGAQKNWQGAPLNKQLIQSASNEVITNLADKAASQIKAAVEVELKSRELIAQAESLANSDQYKEAIDTLNEIVQDSVHFKETQDTIKIYEMEKHCLELVNEAKGKAKIGQYSSAIKLLREVDNKSKRYKLSINLISEYNRLLAIARAKAKHKHLDTNLSHTNTSNKHK